MNYWWLDPNPVGRLSPEERRARMAIWGLFIPVFLALFGLEAFVLNKFGTDHHLVALVGVITTVPTSLYVSRKFCLYCWPEMMRRADENAEKRVA